MTASEASPMDEARRRREGEQDADLNISSSEPFTSLQLFAPLAPVKRTLGSKKHTFALAAALQHLGKEAGDAVLMVGEERLTAYSAILQARGGFFKRRPRRVYHFNGESPTAWKAVLRFMHSDRLHIDLGDVWLCSELLSVARRFEVESLAETLEAALTDSISLCSISMLLEATLPGAPLAQLKKLRRACLAWARRAAVSDPAVARHILATHKGDAELREEFEAILASTVSLASLPATLRIAQHLLSPKIEKAALAFAAQHLGAVMADAQMQALLSTRPDLVFTLLETLHTD